MSTSKELITELYIGYFDRAPDPEGLTFWISVLEGGLSIEAIAQDFAGQPEAQATYDFLDTSGPDLPASAAEVETFINAIYDNLFDRAPDAAGLAFWTGVLQDGYPAGEFILAIIGGASAADRAVLDNKIEVACAWSDAAAADGDFALSEDYINDSRDALGEVDADPASVTAGKDAADLFFQEGPHVTLAGTTTTLAEDTDTSARVKVADIIITDDGVGTNVLALSGADAALFEIDGLELFLQAGAALDFETNANLDVTVTVDDADFEGTPDDSVDLTIAVTDVNEAPTVALANVLADISEDADTSAATKVADIVVSDDALGTNALTLSGVDAASFEIVGSELFLKAGSVLDFETNATLDVAVEVDDAGVGGTPDDAAVLALPVADANEAPAVTVTPLIATLAEDADTSARIKVGDIAVTDDALGTNDLTLTGADAALFEIDGFELFLKAGSALDFEGNPDLDVTVVVDDAGVGATPDDTDSMSVAVTDVNEAPSVTLSSAVTTLAEDTDTAAAIKMADIVIADDGQGTNTLGLAGADAALFEIVGTELFLKAGTVLDFEFNAELDVLVTVDDTSVGGTPDASASLTVAITDVNEAPGLTLTNTVTGLLENDDTSARIKVADIVLSDDALGTNVLSLTGADAGLFEIDGAELFLKAGTALNFDTNPNLDVSVTVDDATLGGNPDAVADLTVAISDTNGAPEIDLANLSTVLDENLDTSLRVKVADIVVTDDALGTNVLTLSGADAGLFEIDGTDLFLKVGTALDFETNPSLDISVSVDDPSLGASAEDSVSASIAVTDVNETPTISLTTALVTLPEGTSTASRIKVADIVVTDDGLGLNTLALTGADADLFEIDGMELFLKAGTVLDFEDNSLLEAAVTVDDTDVGTSPDASAMFALNITNINETPSVALTGTQTDFFEGIDTTNRVQVATIVLNDDGTGTNVLGLAGSDAGLFEIDGNGLFLKAGTALDAAANPVLDVIVTVDDAALPGSPDDIDSLSITVKPGAAGAATDATDELTFIGNAASVVRFGQIEVADADPDTPGDQPGFVFNTDPSDTPYAGVAGSSLNLIDTTGHDGLVSLGVIAEVDADDFTLDNSGSSGDVEACIGTGNDGGVLVTPTMVGTSTWIFDNSGATGKMEITLKALDAPTGFALVFNNVDIVVDGDVDLTGLGFGLDIDPASTVEVLEGATLTLTVQQVDQMQAESVTIFGEGTVVVTGVSDDSDTDLNTNFGNLATGTVDLSAVTLADDDTTDAVEIAVSGALDAGGSALLDGDGVRVTQTVIGTAHNDAATVGFSASDGDTGTIDVILELGADDGDIGDPLDTPEGTADPAEMTGDTIDLDSTFADVQINADAGFDAVTGAFGLPDGTVIQVAAGAEFYAGVVTGDYLATSATTNDGTAVLEALGTMDKTLNVAAAGGSAGWTLIGAADAALSANTLVGSELDDVIQSGNLAQTASAAVDIMTGNGGADIFEFDHGRSTPVAPIVAETTAPVDEEIIDVFPDDIYNADEGLVVTIAINGVSAAYAIDLVGVDVTNDSAITAATTSQLNAVAGLSASVSGGNVSVIADGSSSVAVLGVAATGTVVTLGGSSANGTDTAEVSRITIDAGVSAGEVYSALITLANGTTIGAEYEVGQNGDPITQLAVRDGLQSEIDDAITAVGGVTVSTAAGGAGEIDITDLNADNGGFTLTAEVTPAVVSTGASLFGAGGVSIASNFVDSITDFVSGDDKIDLNAVAGNGSVANYAEGPAAATYGAALAAAGGVIDGTVSYYMTSSTADSTGLLFFDADGNGSIDGVVNMVGLDENSFEFADIIA
jgi:Domain of unknown function (DUF4214)